MSPNTANTSNESASDHLGPRSAPTSNEPAPRTPRRYCLAPRDNDWVVNTIASPSLINGIVRVKTTWGNDAVWRDSVRNYDLSKFATDNLGSFELAYINGRSKIEGKSVLQVGFCDSLVEVKDLGEHWLNRARKLVIKKWGKRRGEKIWRRQLRYKRQFEGNM